MKIRRGDASNSNGLTEPEEARDGAGRDKAVRSMGYWDALETRGLGGASRRVGSPLPGWKRSPWQAESLAAAGGPC